MGLWASTACLQGRYTYIVTETLLEKEETDRSTEVRKKENADSSAK
jgi:hypothetical protein